MKEQRKFDRIESLWFLKTRTRFWC